MTNNVSFKNFIMPEFTLQKMSLWSLLIVFFITSIFFIIKSSNMLYSIILLLLWIFAYFNISCLYSKHQVCNKIISHITFVLFFVLSIVYIILNFF